MDEHNAEWLLAKNRGYILFAVKDSYNNYAFFAIIKNHIHPSA